MKIACLVTGAPRTFDKCVASLKRYLRDHEVDFFCVFRNDNSDEFVTKSVMENYNPLAFKITDAKDTKDAELTAGFHWPFIRMWHEVSVGRELIAPFHHKYDAFMRVRFDAFFGNEVVIDKIPPRTCIVPKIYSFLGANDMFCLSDWEAFCAYSSVYDKINEFRSRLPEFTPEVLVLNNLLTQGIALKEEDIVMSLRRPLYDHLTDEEYSVLTHNVPERMLIKYETFENNPEKFNDEVASMTELARKQVHFPTNSPTRNHFYDPEFNDVHQKHYRFFAGQSWIYRYIGLDKTAFRFIIIHKVSGFPVEKFAVFIEGVACTLSFTPIPEGGWLVTGNIPEHARGKAPRAKIGFMYNYTVIPAEVHPDSRDTRLLSAAITEPEFF